MTYSRRQTIEEKNNKRKAIGFTFLSIGFVLFMFFYGLPLLVKLANLAYDLRKGSEAIEIADTTPPPPPRIETLPQFTNKNAVVVEGGSESSSIVVINLNGTKEEVVADNNGRFSITLAISDGDNFLKAYAKDSANNKSNETQTYTIIYDNDPPEIEISSPQNNSDYYGSTQKSLTIKGSTKENAQVQINDRLAIVDSSGKFSLTTQLAEGNNSFTIKATDKAGNMYETTLTVNYAP